MKIHTLSQSRPRRLAVLLIAGAVVANVAFAGLGSAFDYPAVLQRPAGEVLAAFRDRQLAISLWFALLAAGAFLLAPISVQLARLHTSPAMRWIPTVGIAAATVQVVGLLRWPTVVPFLATATSDPARAANAESVFRTLNQVFGTVIGETVGYALTAAWTILVIRALAGHLLGKVTSALGVAAAILIASGVAIPAGVPGTDLANFVGYILWSLWLVVVGVIVWRADLADSSRERPTSRAEAIG